MGSLSTHAKEQVLVNALNLAESSIYEDPVIPQEYPGREGTEQELHEQEKELQRWLAEQEQGWCNEQSSYHQGEEVDLEHPQRMEFEHHQEPDLQHGEKEQLTAQNRTASEEKETHETNNLLSPLAEQLKCEVLFSVSKGKRPEMVPVIFRRRPLGIEFDRPFVSTAKVRVKCVKQLSHGAELGVQKGWLLTAVEGKDLPRCHLTKHWQC